MVCIMVAIPPALLMRGVLIGAIPKTMILGSPDPDPSADVGPHADPLRTTPWDTPLIHHPVAITIPVMMVLNSIYMLMA
jgi:hypothetical protein